MLDIMCPKKRFKAWVVNKLVYVYYVICRLFGRRYPLKENLRNKVFKKILVVRLDHIGDVLLTTPIYEALRRHYPKAEIHAIVGSWAKPVVEQISDVDKLYIYNAPWFLNIRAEGDNKIGISQQWKDLWSLIKRFRKESFDLVIDPRGDLRHLLFFGFCIKAKYILGYGRTGGEYFLSTQINFESEIHELKKSARLMELLGIEDMKEKVCLREDQQAVQVLDGRIKESGLGQRNLVVICPGARKRLKMWPIENVIQVTQELIDKYPEVGIVFVGAKSDRIHCDAIEKRFGGNLRVCDRIGKTSLMELFSLLKRSKMIITNDGPVAHMSSALSVPTIVLFGSTPAERFKPLGDHVHVMVPEKHFPCCPCELTFCSVTQTSVRPACMEDICARSVITKAVSILNL